MFETYMSVVGYGESTARRVIDVILPGSVEGEKLSTFDEVKFNSGRQTTWNVL